MLPRAPLVVFHKSENAGRCEGSNCRNKIPITGVTLPDARISLSVEPKHPNFCFTSAWNGLPFRYALGQNRRATAICRMGRSWPRLNRY
jgi:hypothetical protein